MLRNRKWILGATAAVASLLIAACGGGNPASSDAGDGASAASDTIVIGSANFEENVLLAEIYAEALRANGVDVSTRLNIGARAAYIPGIEDGSIDLIPEYSGVLLQYFDTSATAESSADVYDALQKVVPAGLIVLDYSQAEDKDAIVVSKAVADQYNLTSIADLAAVASELVLGGPPEFKTRPDGVPGLESNYGVKFGSYKTLDAGGPLTVNALKNGGIDAGDMFTTDPSITANGFVVLADPENNFTAQNVLPLINEAKASDTVKSVLNEVSAALDTQTLIDLNTKVILNHENPETVAKAWLASVGLV